MPLFNITTPICIEFYLNKNSIRLIIKCVSLSTTEVCSFYKYECKGKITGKYLILKKALYLLTPYFCSSITTKKFRN